MYINATLKQMFNVLFYEVAHTQFGVQLQLALIFDGPKRNFEPFHV